MSQKHAERNSEAEPKNSFLFVFISLFYMLNNSTSFIHRSERLLWPQTSTVCRSYAFKSTFKKIHLMESGRIHQIWAPVTLRIFLLLNSWQKANSSFRLLYFDNYSKIWGILYSTYRIFKIETSIENIYKMEWNGSLKNIGRNEIRKFCIEFIFWLFLKFCT